MQSNVAKPAVLSLLVLTLTLLAVVMASPSLVQSQGNANPKVLPIHSTPNGKTYGEWAAAWWTWVLEIPASSNPLTDQTGEFCDVNQSGPVWFLAGNFGGETHRECTVPTGKKLFFPIVNTFYGFVPGEEVDLEEARAFVKEVIDSATNLACEINGIPVNNLESYREQSPVFSLIFPEDNVFGDPGLDGLPLDPTVDEGIYLMLAPLPRGQHTLHIHGRLESVNLELDVTYVLTVE